jgi:hypothetical protein
MHATSSKTISALDWTVARADRAITVCHPLSCHFCPWCRNTESNLKLFSISLLLHRAYNYRSWYWNCDCGAICAELRIYVTFKVLYILFEFFFFYKISQNFRIDPDPFQVFPGREWFKTVVMGREASARLIAPLTRSRVSHELTQDRWPWFCSVQPQTFFLWGDIIGAISEEVEKYNFFRGKECPWIPQILGVHLEKAICIWTF